MTDIYIYDTNPDVRGIKRLFAYFDSMRYMVLADERYPFGRIVGYGRTPGKARQNAIKKLIAMQGRKTPDRVLVLTDEVEL